MVWSMWMWISGCSWGPSDSHDADELPVWHYIETGDLDAIKARGELRVLYPAGLDAEALPRHGPPLDLHRHVASDLANELGLTATFVPVPTHDQLLDWLQAGKGDVVATNLTVTESRAAQATLTNPITHVREQLVARASGDVPQDLEDLAGRTITVRHSSTYWATAQALAARVPGLTVQQADEHLDTEQLMHQVGTGALDLTVADDNLVRVTQSYREDVVAAFDLTEARPVAWALRPQSPRLAEHVNDFIGRAKMVRRTAEPYTGDLAVLKERRVLRMVTWNSAWTYFLHRGELLGFQYELVRRFAENHGMRVQVVVPPDSAEPLDYLAQGRGDVVAAGLTLTPHRLDRAELEWTRPTMFATEVVIKRAGDPLSTLDQLNGRTVVVHPTSAYWETLSALKAKGDVSFELVAAPTNEHTHQIVDKVAAGIYDLTMADSPVAHVELAYRDDVAIAFEITEALPHGWAVRAEDADLLTALNTFLEAEVDGPFYNVVKRRYFEDQRTIARNATDRVDRGGQISPYDELVQQYASRYGFDWRLVAAQMYQESHFDPNARSWVGAQGLLQLMPRTARELGFTDVVKPENGIHAGVQYLARMRDRFEPELPHDVRTSFALASYNAGFGHVVDARRLAERQGLDPDQWYNHTEQAMLLLAKPEHAANARYGFVRGTEPVNYVRRIQDRYAAYAQASESP